MSREITVYRKAVQGDADYLTPDANYGTERVVWVPLSYLPGSPAVAERYRAEVQDVLASRSEALKQGIRMAANQTRIRMRWRNDIDSTMKVTVHGDTDQEYQIISGPVEIEGRKVRIEMMCERYSTAGNG